MNIKIGILAIQGGFSEHKNALDSCINELSLESVEIVEIRSVKDISLEIDGIVLPGGESTAMSPFLQKQGFGERLKSFISGELCSPPPVVWGTCGGLIMLANSLENQKEGGQAKIGGLDVVVSRNYFGRQLQSFEGPVHLNEKVFESKIFHGVFIRAPAVLSCDTEKVTILGTVKSRTTSQDQPVIVAVQQGNLIATSFHPELTGDLTWQRYFLNMILATKKKMTTSSTQS